MGAPAAGTQAALCNSDKYDDSAKYTSKKPRSVNLQEVVC